MGFCPVGFCPSGILSLWAFILVGFCPTLGRQRCLTQISIGTNANSADPDQTPRHNAASDHGHHCLLTYSTKIV